MLLFVALYLSLMQGEQTQLDASEWKRLGLALAAEKKITAAVGPLTKACELDPKDEEACYYFARMLHALGRWDEACAPFEKALRAAPKRMLARVHRAVALNFMALGHTVEAEQHFKAAIAMRKDAEVAARGPACRLRSLSVQAGAHGRGVAASARDSSRCTEIRAGARRTRQSSSAQWQGGRCC